MRHVLRIPLSIAFGMDSDFYGGRSLPESITGFDAHVQMTLNFDTMMPTEFDSQQAITCSLWK